MGRKNIRPKGFTGKVYLFQNMKRFNILLIFSACEKKNGRLRFFSRTNVINNSYRGNNNADKYENIVD